MNVSGKTNIGIGFATGRRNFKQVLRTYTHNWREAGLTDNENYNLDLLVAYDLKCFMAIRLSQQTVVELTVLPQEAICRI